ncbi:uncharacterized protein A4U43_C10F12170 [Asparagus officinalis]|uniref:Uncharacterized protein n=1 Tax=Asparagus officinalis TaxID=4686 RepID=A0A5P1E283_ASPOF|nr:uncharacterized protein A4U43_C10F12170 [Asparagus officinalis]
MPYLSQPDVEPCFANARRVEGACRLRESGVSSSAGHGRAVCRSYKLALASAGEEGGQVFVIELAAWHRAVGCRREDKGAFRIVPRAAPINDGAADAGGIEGTSKETPRG